MRLEFLALGLASVSVVAAPERVTTPEEAVCSWVKTQWLLDIRSERAILVVATEEWWYAPYADMPFYNPEDVQIAAQARYPRPPDSTVYRAQRFVVAAAGSAHDLDAGASLWVVPLEGCLSTGGQGPLQREEWIPGGDTVTFLLDPRAVGAGPDGSPLFRQHVQFGPHPGSDEARGSSELSGTQYFGFVHALPSSQVLASDPRTALEALETWLASENVDSTSYPVKQTLEDLRRERELRPIFWGGYPTLVGCYEVGMGPPSGDRLRFGGGGEGGRHPPPDTRDHAHARNGEPGIIADLTGTPYPRHCLRNMRSQARAERAQLVPETREETGETTERTELHPVGRIQRGGALTGACS